MQKISISKMGPIKDLTISLDKSIDIIIGPQASGKSTLVKTIYFCMKVRDYFVDFTANTENFINGHKNELFLNFNKYIRRKFMGYFGTTKHMDEFNIKYDYDANKQIMIYLENGYAKVKFSDELDKIIRNSLNKFYDIYIDYEKNNDDDILANISKRLQFINGLKTSIVLLAEDVFSNKEEIVYIPAGRSLLSVLSDQLDVVNTNGLDLPMKDFIDKIRIVKKSFGSRLNSIVSDYVKTIKGQIKNNDVQLAQELISKILKGEYINDTDSEKLYIDKIHWVKLIYASSGQQEALWILLLLFMSILTQKRTFFIIEEPEAHLYPVAQYNMVELIALTVNSVGSRIFITTHSPYILSSANLLVYSGLIEGKRKLSSNAPIIKKQMRIGPDTLNAFKITEQFPWDMYSIIDQESGMVDSSQIDTISTVINQDFDRLLDLELKA